MSFRQIPGAVRRLLVTLALALLAAVACGAIAHFVYRAVSADAAKLARSRRVLGTLRDSRLPPKDQREDAVAKVSVIYVDQQRSYSATDVPMAALDAEGLGPGAEVALYVDPLAPEHPEEARVLEARVKRKDLLPYGAGVGLLAGIALLVIRLRSLVQRELHPIRLGAIVWLTPDEPLPETRGEVRFRAHYLRGDRTLQVLARGRPGRAPVRNGEKILAAVVPTRPDWVQVVDEDLARALGWLRG